MNALLYGSRKSVLDDEEAEGSSSSHRRLRRPKPTRWTAKLPRGLKATTSARPGETREISFYQRSSNVDDSKVSIVLVDLPGYGFAFASPEREAEWQSLMKSYLLGRGKSLKRILLLIDARHGMKKADFDFLQSMQDPNLGIETTNIDKDDHRSSSSSKVSQRAVEREYMLHTSSSCRPSPLSVRLHLSSVPSFLLMLLQIVKDDENECCCSSS